MAKRGTLILGAALALGSAGSAHADTGVVVGDSLGVGVSMASHLKSFAKNSISIRATGAIDQIERAPEGSTVFLSLGTNDAVGNIDGLSAGIQRVVAAANRAKVKLVWMGPPCVLKPWNKNAETLDGELKQTLGGTSVTYVSMQDQRLCDRSIHAKDGVHFSMTGYRAMWDKARNAAGFTATAGETAAAEAPASDSVKPKSQAKVKKAKVVRKKRRTKRSRTKPSAESTSSSAAAPVPAAAAAPQ